MHMLFTVRAARGADSDELTQLARLSKAHWGYPKEWLDLWQSDLTISPETIEGSDVPDFFGPVQSWRTASIASVEQYRCLNSLGVR